MKSILVLGGSYLQSDFVETALNNGYNVHVLDKNPNCYLAYNLNLKFQPLDISNIVLVDEYFRKSGCDFVVSPVTEIGNKVAAEISKKYGLLYNSIETVLCSTNKSEMRKRLNQSKLLEPKAFTVKNMNKILKSEINFPVIVKPSVSSASRGVTLANSYEELNFAVKRAIPYCASIADVLIEEYLEGDQYSIETISSYGWHEIVAIVREELSDAPYYMERNDIIDIEKNKLLLIHVKTFINELLNCIGVTTGPCHVEVKIDNNHQIRLIEVATRSGLLRDKLIRAAKGSEYNELILKSYLGESITDVKLPTTNALLGIIAHESDLDIFNSAQEFGLVVESFLNGNRASKGPKMLTDAIGYYFLQSDNIEVFEKFKVKL